jgi:glycerophosphoryl diester phosphodiesterase
VRRLGRSEPVQPPTRPVVVAHRGASTSAAEHTLGAYVRAVQTGADALECDVRLTRDGHLVCVHDRTVDRTSDGRGVVSEFDLQTLSELDFASWHRELPDSADELVVDDSYLDTPYFEGVAPDLGEDGRVLTLDRLLQLVADAGRPLTVFVETKHPTRYKGLVEQELARTLRRFGLVPGGRRRSRTGSRAVVMSFSPIALRRVRLLEPELPVVQLMWWVYGPARSVVVPGGVPILGPALRLLRADPELVRRAHARGRRIYTWTINDPADLDFVLDLGVDYVATDRPADVRAQLHSQPRPPAPVH